MKFYLMCLVVAIMVATTVISCSFQEIKEVTFISEDGYKWTKFFEVRDEEDLYKQIDEYINEYYVERDIIEEPVAILIK